MARPRTYKTEAVVLKQTPIGEADRILTFYTPDLGKVRAVAKGVRRTKSKLGGHLELLTHVSVALAQGRNLDVVTEAQGIESFRGFREDLARLSQALYLAELMDGFSAEQSPNYAVYQLLLASLGWLERTAQPHLLLRHFEVRLLEASGFRPELYQCVECRTELEPGDHMFSAAAGGAMCPTCRANTQQALMPLSLNAMKVLRFLLREETFARVEGLRVSASLMAETQRLVREYLKFLLERELKSAEFMGLVSSGRASRA